MSIWLLLYALLIGSPSTHPLPDIPTPVCAQGRPC